MHAENRNRSLCKTLNFHLSTFYLIYWKRKTINGKKKKKSKEKTVRPEECHATRTGTGRRRVPPSHVTGVTRTREGNAAWTAAGVEIPRPCGKARWHSVTLSPSKPASRDSPINDSPVNRKHGAVGTPAAAVFKRWKGGKPGAAMEKAATA